MCAVLCLGFPAGIHWAGCHQPQHKVPQQLGLHSQALVDGVSALSANTGRRVNAGSLSFTAAAANWMATGIHLGSEAVILLWIIMLE